MRAPTKRRRIALGALLLCCLAIVSTLALFAYWRGSHHGLPYRDAFALGKADEWKAFGGTWALYGGGMRNDSDERGAKLMTGSEHWKNYSVEADVKLLGEDGDAGLIIRSSDEEDGVDSYSGYYAGLRTRDNQLTLGLADHGWHEYRNVPMPAGVHAFTWYHLKILAFNCDIIASATFPLHSDDRTVVAVKDENCLTSGRIGLRSYSSGGLWRNVIVRKVSRTDLDTMLGSQLPRSVSHAGSSLPGSAVFGSGSMPSHVDLRPVSANDMVQPISSLRLLTNSPRVTATIRGVVSLATPALYVQDATGGAAVFPINGPPLKVGDEVRVKGVVDTKDFNSVIRDASVELLWARTPIPPISVTPSQAATGAFAATFIEIEGVLIGQDRDPEKNLVLHLSSSQQEFRAIVNGSRGDAFLAKMKHGSVVRLRGVCVVDPEFTHSLTPFVLLLRSADDVELVAGPPWWNARHVVIIGFLLLVLAFIAQLIHAMVERWKLRAIMQERELLAHEMHDALAQSFAGLGFQLQAIRNRIPNHMPTIHAQLDLACDLVRHSHQEARQNIMMLRTESMESLSLAQLLQQSAQKMVEGGAVIVEASETGYLRTIPLRVNDTLFRIGLEALANAIRHAQPSRICIGIHHGEDTVTLRIEDDGVGFESNDTQRGFGVKGMRRRAATISASLEISGVQGEGTSVRVIAPLLRDHSFKRGRTYLRWLLHNGKVS